MTAEPPLLYGLDIETDTATGGLDPSCSAILAVAVAGPEHTEVFHGPEPRILAQLDAALQSLPPGVLVTWNGGGFDLPFLHHRAGHHRLPLGLRLWPDQRVPARRPMPGCDASAYAGAWHLHGHVDAYRLWGHVRLALGVSASLKSIAAHLGLTTIEADASRVHELTPAELSRYVARDAELAVELARRGWAWASSTLDPPPPPLAPAAVAQAR